MALRILSGGAANGLINAVRARFAAETGLTIEGDFGAVGAMRDRVTKGEPVDLVILTRAIVDDLARQGLVDPDSVADIGEVVTGVAVVASAPKPDISRAEALRAALAEASAIYVPDTTKATAGIHVARTIEKLGLKPSIGPRLREFPNGQTAMKAMAADGGTRALGCTQITEILNTPGVTYVGPLPPPHELATVYTAAVAVNAAEPEAARTLVRILTADEAGEDRRRVGFSQ
jgi:molybdate transport system substrate-binding protein